MKTNQWVANGLLLAGAVAGAAYAERLRRRSAFRFTGKSVVITGGSRGFGLIMARRLVAEGAHVALLARNVDELERAHRELVGRSAPGQRIVTLQCDVRDQESVQSAIEQVAKQFGGIDVLINNAGVIMVGPMQHLQPADYEDAIATHFWGPLYATYAVLPYMRQQGGGRIVNISSSGGRISVPHLASYSVSKAALAALSDALRFELARENIVVTGVYPITMRTGAHVNAQFKGQHREEFTIFALLASLPLIAQDAEGAGRSVLEACRRGDAALYIPGLFRFSPALNMIAPNVISGIMTWINRLLPRSVGRPGDVAKEGWDCTTSLAPSVLTRLGDKATVENNGLRGHQPLVSDVVPNGSTARPAREEEPYVDALPVFETT